MSTASNTTETGFFTLLVPPVVAVYIPHRMVGSGRAASLPVVGGLLFPVGATRLLLLCGVVRAGARHPRAHQPDQAARLSPARIASIATLCTLPCSPLSLDSRRSSNGPPLRPMVCFYFHAFISSLFSVKSALCALNLTANTRISVAACRAGYRG